MTERIPRGIAALLVEVSEKLPEPLPSTNRGSGRFSGGSRPPLRTGRGLYDRGERPNPYAKELTEEFMIHWTTIIPFDEEEAKQLETLEAQKPSRSVEANLAAALFGKPTPLDELVAEQDELITAVTDRVTEILDSSRISTPAKTFLVTIFYETASAGIATVDVVNFKKIGIDPVKMFTRIPEDTSEAEEALFEFHEKVLEAAEEEIARPSKSTVPNEQVDPYWTVDPDFLEEQKQLHSEWEQTLAS